MENYRGAFVRFLEVAVIIASASVDWICIERSVLTQQATALPIYSLQIISYAVDPVYLEIQQVSASFHD